MSEDQHVEVFCDGSVTNAVMLDPFSSEIGTEYVGRAMVVVPALDVGLIEQSRHGVVTARGTPASTEAEVFAIRLALRACQAWGLSRYTVFNDCRGAIGVVKSGHVEWRSREQMYLPNSFFDKVLGRAGYLRQSSKTVKNRKPLEPHQREAFELFCADRRDFKLSDSSLWQRVVGDAQRHGHALGVPTSGASVRPPPG